MATPEQATRFLPAPQRRTSRLWTRLVRAHERLVRSDARFAPWVIFAGFVLAPGVATEQWQYVLFVVLVTMSGCLYWRWPTAGLALVVILWTFSPLFRRLLDYFVVASSGPDILSLAPFVATFVIGAMAYRQQRPSGPVLAVIISVWVGLAWGAFEGLNNPFALTFGLFSYTAGSMGLLLGYLDWKRGGLVLEKILVILIPVIAAYGIYQYLVPVLPPWDDFWLRTAAPISTGAKETGDLRIFSVVNSPGTLAGILSLYAVMVIMASKLTPMRLLAGALTMAALALGQVRSAYLGIALALVALIPLSRGLILARIAVLVVMVGGMYALFGGSQAGQAVVDRATSVTETTSDGSINARITAVQTFGPEALTTPLGHGVGSVSQAARVSITGPAPFEDNGYLLIMWQVGLLGFVLIFGAMLGGTLYGARSLNSYRRKERYPLLGIMVVTAVFTLSGDTLYGLPAVIMWYCLGALMASSEDPDRFALLRRKQARRAAALAPRPQIGAAPDRARVVLDPPVVENPSPR